MTPREPTSDECSTHAPLGDGWYAIWYPQMGGYVGKAAVQPGDEDSCIEVYVWHDGEFPFSCGQADRDVPENPVRLHHCDADQFIVFGEELKRLQGADNLNEDITTFTPMMWASMTDEQRYEEYIRVRKALIKDVTK